VAESNDSVTAVRLTNQLQHEQHIVGNGGINTAQVYRVPATIFSRIVPSEQEVSHPTRLSGVLRSYHEQAPYGFIRFKLIDLFHLSSIFVTFLSRAVPVTPQCSTCPAACLPAP